MLVAPSVTYAHTCERRLRNECCATRARTIEPRRLAGASAEHRPRGRVWQPCYCSRSAAIGVSANTSRLLDRPTPAVNATIISANTTSGGPAGEKGESNKKCISAQAPPNERIRPVAADSSPSTVYSDRKSTRLNSSHMSISYAVFCLKKKKHKAA